MEDLNRYTWISETASAMNKRRWEKGREVTVESLLREAGYDPDEAPEHLKILAKLASGGRSGAVSALRDFPSPYPSGNRSERDCSTPW